MYEFELRNICKNMKFKGWQKLSKLKLERYVHHKQVEACIRIQRWVRRKIIQFVNNKNIFSMQSITPTNGTFILYENHHFYVFNARDLFCYFAYQGEKEKKNPFTNTVIKMEYLKQLQSCAFKN